MKMKKGKKFLPLRLYNTLSRKVEDFKPLKAGKVGIYSCGPTVYWNQHIGNMYCYVQWDGLVRFLRYLGFKVKWVMNITDVGHLVSDADEGEDKMEKGARRENVSVWDIAQRYIDQFLASVDLLNIQKPDVLCRATAHIKEQIALAQKIERNGFAYKTKTGLVFDTSKFPQYADFARLDLEKQAAGARVEVDPEKKKPWDFLLWVTNQPKHIMQWDSPWGKGFPGWHIECTAMSAKYLGRRFDIHTGGIEHISVHHTNEIAQGFGAFGHQTANYWLHNEWLVLKDQKMSKSMGNVYTVQNLVERGYDPLAFRYLIMTSHYRKGLVFSLDSLSAAETALNNLRENIFIWRRLPAVKKVSAAAEKFKTDFLAALASDLNWPQAMAMVWKMVKSNLSAAEKLNLLLDFDSVLGLKLAEAGGRKKVKIPQVVKTLLTKRQNLRAAKNWAEADKIREEIEKLGFKVADKEGKSEAMVS
jgi:cysteinyl-tRNA synthetase